MESRELTKWIQECAALVAPPADWEPDVNRARARFEARLRGRPGLKRWLLVGAAAALLAGFAVVAISPGHALAQQIGNNHWFRVEQLWYMITAGRSTSAIRWDNLPEDVRALRTHPLSRPGAAQIVPDTGEAARRAGFVPRLPRSSVLSGGPRLSVLDPMSFDTVIGTANLERALRKMQALDAEVPKQWDGARIVLQIGSTVKAEWSDVRDEWSGAIEWSELTLVQGAVPVIATPPGFDLAAFTVASLRAAARMNRDTRARLSQHPATAPALLFGSGTHNLIFIREVNLRTVPAIVLEEVDNGLVERCTLLWSVPGRMYLLSGAMSIPPGVFDFDMAGALVNAVHLANSIQ